MSLPRFAVDTSVAIPLLVTTHAEHLAVTSWAGDRKLSLSGHSLAETYSVLTRLPGPARISPAQAAQLIDDNFDPHLVIAAEHAQTVHQELARFGISGGATYDALVALASVHNNATLVTRDARALPTYAAVGVRVELIPSSPGPTP